jgi:hypothetical protein
MSAKLTALAEPLPIFIDNMESESQDAQVIFNQSQLLLPETSSDKAKHSTYIHTKTLNEAFLILEVDSKGIRMRLSKELESAGISPPRLKKNEIEVILNAIRDIALFDCDLQA